MSIDSPSQKLSEEPEIYSPKKSVTLFYALFLIIGNIVGSGIFITVKETFQVFDSDSIGMVLVFWLSAGIISLLGGLHYAELGCRITESGGERAYYKNILSDKMSKVFVIFFVFLIRTLAVAALSITFGSYLCDMINPEWVDTYIEKLFGLAIIVLCFFINCFSKTLAMKASAVLTVLKIVAMLIIIGSGLYYMITGENEEWEEPFELEGFSLVRLGICYINLLWTYEGWNTLGLIAGDMKNPRKNLFIAIVTGVSIVVILYVMTVMSYSAVLGYEVARNSTTLGVLVGKKVLKSAYYIIPILVCCSAAGTINGILFAVSCVASSAGHTGALPLIFSLLHKKSRTPIFSLVIITLISISFLTFRFQDIINYSAFLSWVFYFISFTCLWKIKLETRHESHSDIFTIPYIFIIPMQVVCVFVIIMAFYLEYLGCSIVGAFFVVILALQYIPERYCQCVFFSKIQDRVIKFCQNYFNMELATLADIS